MSKMKKLVSVMLALVMVLSLGTTAFAEEETTDTTYTITITSEKSGHVYEAYQIFSGDLNDAGTVLSNIKWGTGIDETAFLSALQDEENNATLAEIFGDCVTAADVAEQLAKYEDNSDVAEAFAQLASENLSSTVAGTSTESTSPYTITGLSAGYYLIKDQDDSVTAKGDAYTDIILKVVKDVTVEVKADYPSLDKKIVEGEDGVETNNASVGDTVSYKLTSAVPDMSGYTKYYFVVTDTLSKGLTYTDNSMKITVGDTELTEGTDYVLDVIENTDGTTTIEIVFTNFIQYADQTGAAIIITYDATVNENAVIGSEGNDNTVKLTYSNNPNVTDSGDPENPDKPGSDSPTGETPEEITTTYVTGIRLTKVDPDGNILTGAVFTIKGETVNIVEVTTEAFVEDADGEYWKLTDGTYTTTAPVTTGGDDDTSAYYASTTTKYTKTTTITTEWVTTSKDVTATATVDENGVLVFNGLSAGTYTITEIVAPDGYNLLDEPIELTIGWSAETAGEDCTWTVTGSATVNNDGIIELTVENKAGSELPSTGGIGTTIFYIIGTVLALGAAILLITRKRMRKAE